jgi:hypothetical protein
MQRSDCAWAKNRPEGREGERMSKLDLYLVMLGSVLLFVWILMWLLG